MKKIIVSLIALLCFTASVKALDETFDTDVMTNMVATIKEKATLAMDTSDDTKYRVPILRIDRFVSAVAMEESFPADKKAEIRSILKQLSLIATQVTEKFEDVIDAKQVRAEQVSLSTLGGTVYGIDCNEIRDLATVRFGQDLVAYEHIKKKMLKVQKALKTQIERLGKTS